LNATNNADSLNKSLKDMKNKITRRNTYRSNEALKSKTQNEFEMTCANVYDMYIAIPPYIRIEWKIKRICSSTESFNKFLNQYIKNNKIYYEGQNDFFINPNTPKLTDFLFVRELIEDLVEGNETDE